VATTRARVGRSKGRVPKQACIPHCAVILQNVDSRHHFSEWRPHYVSKSTTATTAHLRSLRSTSEVRRFCFQASPNADLRRRLRCRPYSPGKSESASAPDHFLKCCHLDICAHRALDFDRCACRSAQDYGNNDHPWHRWALWEGEPYTCCRCEDVNVDWYRPRCVCA